MHTIDILIIGAGLSGLMAALHLQSNGQQVGLIDKGRTVGGRLATRAIGPGLADTGAQFFTVREPAFQRYVDEWQAAGLVYVWSTGWSDGSLIAAAPTNDGYPRYAINGGMNALARHLAAQVSAQGVTIQTEQPISAICQNGGGMMFSMCRAVTTSSPSTVVTGGASSISFWPMLEAWT